MAKKKGASPTTSGVSSRVSSGIEKAENGFIIRVSKESDGKNASYTSRTFIAPNGRAAMRIATSHIQSAGPKLKQKKMKGKAAGRKR